MHVRSIYFLFILFALVGCATTSTRQVAVSASKADVYGAAIRTLVRNGFQVTRTDRESGIIAGRRSIKQALTTREARDQIRVTVLVEEASERSTLFVTWTPPEGALGTFEPEHNEFLQGLSVALPDAQIK